MTEGSFRAQIREYHAKLYQLREEPSLKILKHLIEVMVAESDTARRKCSPDQLAGLQGETVAYLTLLKCLTVAPIEIPKGPQQ